VLPREKVLAALDAGTNSLRELIKRDKAPIVTATELLPISLCLISQSN